MQEITHNSIIQEPNRIPWLASLVFLSFTLLSMLGLWGYQFIMASHIETLHTDIVGLERDIQLASADRNIIVANILSSATIRPSIDLKTLVNSFRTAASQAGVRLQGFSVKDAIIVSTLIATRDSNGADPVETIIAMMRNQVDNTGLSLVPIHSLQGTNAERTTAVSFRILPTNPTTNATK